MNDTEIKNIDKLKNLLIEFGVKFSQVDYENVSYIDMLSLDTMYTATFAFTPSGKFSHISEN